MPAPNARGTAPHANRITRKGVWVINDCLAEEVDWLYFLSMSTESTKERPSREVPSLENLSCQHQGILRMPKGVPTLSYTRYPASSPGQEGSRGSLVALKIRPTWSNNRQKEGRRLFRSPNSVVGQGPRMDGKRGAWCQQNSPRQPLSLLPKSFWRVKGNFFQKVSLAFS